jgi:hypothetical protein
MCVEVEGYVERYWERHHFINALLIWILFFPLPFFMVRNNTFPFQKISLSSRNNRGYLMRRSSANSQVALDGDKVFQWTKTCVSVCLWCLTILLSRMAWGCNFRSEFWAGKLSCTTLFPACCFNWEIWNTRCITLELGKAQFVCYRPYAFNYLIKTILLGCQLMWSPSAHCLLPVGL